MFLYFFFFVFFFNDTATTQIYTLSLHDALPIYVGEPSVEDTISILRGIKEKYELHHGVRITDAAIVAAATLANRYITDRFLPDKAIDLMDEAAARLRMTIDSKPEE